MKNIQKNLKMFHLTRKKLYIKKKLTFIKKKLMHLNKINIKNDEKIIKKLLRLDNIKKYYNKNIF